MAASATIAVPRETISPSSASRTTMTPSKGTFKTVQSNKILGEIERSLCTCDIGDGERYASIGGVSSGSSAFGIILAPSEPHRVLRPCLLPIEEHGTLFATAQKSLYLDLFKGSKGSSSFPRRSQRKLRGSKSEKCPALRRRESQDGAFRQTSFAAVGFHDAGTLTSAFESATPASAQGDEPGRSRTTRAKVARRGGGSARGQWRVLWIDGPLPNQ